MFDDASQQRLGPYHRAAIFGSRRDALEAATTAWLWIQTRDLQRARRLTTEKRICALEWRRVAYLAAAVQGIGPDTSREAIEGFVWSAVMADQYPAAKANDLQAALIDHLHPQTAQQ